MRAQPARAAAGMPSVPAGGWIVAVDAGGTFTDAIAVSGTGLTRVAKVPSTPGDPGLAFERALVALAGVLGCVAARPRMPVDAATLALPWLVLPAAILLAVSQIHPVYDARYVVFSLPALALLTATGLAWLTRVVASTRVGRATGELSWVPAVLVLVVFVALVLAPQRSMRLPWSRADNLRKISAIVAASERPGDAVLYLPSNKRVFSMGYPAPFRRLRDISLALSPVAAASLIGSEVPVRTLRARFAGVHRIWVVSGRAGPHLLQHPAGEEQQAEVALLKPFHLIQRWHVQEDVLSLFGRG